MTMILSKRYRCVDCKYFKSSVAYCTFLKAPRSFVALPCENFVFAKRVRNFP